MARRRRRIVKLPSRRIKGRLTKLKQKLKAVALGLVARKAVRSAFAPRSEPPPSQFAAEPQRRRQAEADERQELLDLYRRQRLARGAL